MIHIPHQNDRQLFELISQRNTEAFNELFERYYMPTILYAFHQVRSLDKADQITQEVFVELFQHPVPLESKSAISYLYIAVNKKIPKIKHMNTTKTPHQIDDEAIEKMEKHLASLDKWNARGAIISFIAYIFSGFVITLALSALFTKAVTAHMVLHPFLKGTIFIPITQLLLNISAVLFGSILVTQTAFIFFIKKK